MQRFSTGTRSNKKKRKYAFSLNESKKRNDSSQKNETLTSLLIGLGSGTGFGSIPEHLNSTKKCWDPTGSAKLTKNNLILWASDSELDLKVVPDPFPNVWIQIQSKKIRPQTDPQHWQKLCHTVKLPLEKFKYVFVNQQLLFKNGKLIMHLITHVSLILIQISKTERCVAEVAL
jgi:hypothetical protein